MAAATYAIDLARIVQMTSNLAAVSAPSRRTHAPRMMCSVDSSVRSTKPLNESCVENMRMGRLSLGPHNKEKVRRQLSMDCGCLDGCAAAAEPEEVCVYR